MGCAELVFILTPTPGMMLPLPPKPSHLVIWLQKPLSSPSPSLPMQLTHPPQEGGTGGWARGGMVQPSAPDGIGSKLPDPSDRGFFL